jgi:hypothetical protein
MPYIRRNFKFPKIDNNNMKVVQTTEKVPIYCVLLVTVDCYCDVGPYESYISQ